MGVIWTDPAEEDRERIIFFIAEDNPAAAVEMDILFVTAGDDLAWLPFKGRPGRVKNTRELLVHPHYILVYSHDEAADVVYIKAVLHISRQWPIEAE
jgi:plasmid stabilization system protein ParE